MSLNTFKKKSLLNLFFLTCPFGAFSAGFQLNEHSAAGLGRAFAGEGAIADNAAVLSRNPAAMTLFTQPSISAGITYVNPHVNVEGKSPYNNSLRHDNAAPNEWLPNLNYIHPINDRMALGLSATSYYGLSTKYSDEYAAGMLGGTTELITGNLNFSSAYQLNEYINFGMGFNAVYGKAKLVRHAGELGSAMGIPRNTVITSIKGDTWGFGWNSGLLFKWNENHRFALTYRSKVKLDFDGNYYSQLPATINLPGLPQGTNGKTIAGTLSLELPDIWEFSAWHKLADKWAIHYGFTYSGWRKFTELRAIKKDDGELLFQKNEGFKNNIRMSLGTTYQYTNDITLRAGVAYDDSRVPEKNHSISIPDQDRYWITTGTTVKLNPATSVDLGVGYMTGKKTTFKENAGNNEYSFEVKGKAWLYALNVNYIF